ncbi:hypothetical protein [Paucihalobacter sp.]|uniref:hypothetical protein n=1 Tax=Paucihalobacter sp. TaxID=2850405 RepID=UPI002FE1BCC5
MKNGVYIITGIILLFLAVYIFAYVTTSIDKRKFKKHQKKDVENKIVHFKEELNNDQPIQFQKPKQYNRKKNGTHNKIES